jgi:dTDP-4-dehydrorhamnose 3,5-epimerase
VDFEPLKVPGAFRVLPKRFGDDRGYFQENFKLSAIGEKLGIEFMVRQVNQSMSAAGVVRGIHWADVPPGQGKYVTVQRGAILDFVVDLRTESPTFGQWDFAELSAANGAAMLIGNGIGHAFLSLEDNTVVTYLCTQEYNPTGERSLNPLDQTVGIDFAAFAAERGIGGISLSPKDEAADGLARFIELGLLPASA